MKSSASVVCVLCALSASSVADPSSAPNELTIGSTNRALRTSSANALTSDSLIGGSLGYSRALGLPTVPDLALWADATFAWGGADGTLFQTLGTDIGMTQYTVGARARYDLTTWLVASARLDLGLARASLKLDDHMGHLARDSGWTGVTSGALGLDAVATRETGFALGLRLELGYAAMAPVELAAQPESSSEGTLQLQMTAASLGNLDLSGPWFGISVLSQF